MKLIGKLIKVEEPTSGTSNNINWKRQNVIFECNEYGKLLGAVVYTNKFLKNVCFTVWDDIVAVEELNFNDLYSVEFDISSLEFKDK